MVSQLLRPRGFNKALKCLLYSLLIRLRKSLEVLVESFCEIDFHRYEARRSR